MHMSMTDELQAEFDRALNSLPRSSPPPVSSLHARLRARRVATRAAALAAVAVLVAVGLSVGLAEGPTDPAGAVVLHAAPGVTRDALRADAVVMRNRLAILGDGRARVSIAGGSLVVTGGPTQLTDPTSVLTASPSLLVRPVLCMSGPYHRASQSSPENLPSNCAGTPYAIAPATPDSGGGYTGDAPTNDPFLAAYPSTSLAQDAENPADVALLPIAGSTGERDLVGPTELTLSSKVASARVAKDRFGGWVVRVRLDPAAAAQWDRVAYQNFHLQIAVDLDGSVVTAPLIEPTQTAYSSFNSVIEMSGFQSEGAAAAVAAALQSGPLPIPLHVR
jgi:hypothetical protein